jgi:hypothetical protein
MERYTLTRASRLPGIMIDDEFEVCFELLLSGTGTPTAGAASREATPSTEGLDSTHWQPLSFLISLRASCHPIDANRYREQ